MEENILLSKQIEKIKPFWIEFILDLKYSKKQSKLFAQGYEEKLNELPIWEKLHALKNKHDRCMSAGFKKAGINEHEAFKRAKVLMFDKKVKASY